ncbi:hypothetical protein DM860_014290 [Cuscuta australis]|uniref:Protein kinase domain-containing protein n=1 Tax=Cuscuta australis TaxID=267555 RepID=A0A328DHQ2_9ASTE|nr:hypothetical protein DM860_014290 [Cuscuta australis]
MMMMGVHAAAPAAVHPCLRRQFPALPPPPYLSPSSCPFSLFFVVLIGSLLISSPPAAAAGGGAGSDPDSLAESSADALINFKNTLVAGPNGLTASRELASWDPATAPCSGNAENWRGVLCYNGDVWGLQLENFNLSGDIDVDSLTPLRFLRTLSFMNNAFEGLMPDWRKLGALKSLFLSNNRFSGEIPGNAFASMTSLKKVYLSNNNFAGRIPVSLATTPRLLELKLDNNGFTGTIPEFPPGLKLLNVSNNKLEGRIPRSLSVMDPSTFAGNKDLCGKPLEKVCNPESPPAPTPQSAGPNSDEYPTRPTPPSSSSSLSRLLMLIAICLLALAVIILLIINVLRNRRNEEEPTLGRGGRAAAISSSFSPYSENLSVGGGASSPEIAISPAGNNAPVAKGGGGGVGKLTFVKGGERGQIFDLQDLLRASAEVLGSGNLGSSYKAVMMDGEAVVVKRFKHMNHVGREDFHEHMRRLGRLSHPNLLPLVAYYYRKEEKLLVVDHVPNGSLATHLYGNDSRLDWPTRLKIVKGVTRGLSYLHLELPSLVTPHGHLKSSNVLLDNSFNPLLMDYTLVPVLNCDQLQNILIVYKSPEYARQGRTTKKTDVWTLGILILEAMTGRFPANYLMQCPGYGSEFASWVDSISKGLHDDNGDETNTVFDREMGDTRGSRGEMRKLAEIGLACCQEDLDKRWDLKKALEEVEKVKEHDDD